MTTFSVIQLLLLTLLLWVSKNSLASDLKPKLIPRSTSSKLVLGVGLGSQYINDYRGSRGTHLEVLPFPFIKYSGRFLKIDRQGAHGQLFNSKTVELNISADLALTGDGEDNLLREGMPELDSAIQIGPSLNINLSGKDLSQKWSLRLPVRSVLTFSSEGVDAIGYTFSPKLTYRFLPINKWHIKADIGLLYGSEDYHDYYYSVRERFVTQNRSFFQAKGGFSGYMAKVGAVKTTQHWFYAVNLRYDNLSNAIMLNSPLVETKHHWALTVAVARILYKQ